MLKPTDAFGPGVAAFASVLQKFAQLGRRTRSRSIAETLAITGRAESGGRHIRDWCTRLAGRDQCTEPNLEKTVDAHEAATAGQDERALGYTVD